jgi:hypothetical protein
MAEDPMLAIRRIERALARIEAAASSQGASSAPDDGELERLRAANQALRSRVEGAVARIDGLLASSGAA